jgi:hypothetical protein
MLQDILSGSAFAGGYPIMKRAGWYSPVTVLCVALSAIFDWTALCHLVCQQGMFGFAIKIRYRCSVGASVSAAPDRIGWLMWTVFVSMVWLP